MNKVNLKSITDFIIWLLFVASLVITIALTTAGAYRLIAEPQWEALLLFAAAIVTLGIHYAMRQMPVGGRPRSQ